MPGYGRVVPGSSYEPAAPRAPAATSGPRRGKLEDVTAPSGSEMVGRDREAAVLEAAVEAARNGTGTAVVLAGEPGVGKSTLRAHAEAAACEHGLLVLSGRAVQGGSPTPFRPLAEALSSGFRAEGPPRGPAVTALLPTLAHLVPHWSQRAAPGTSVIAIGEALLKLIEMSGRNRGVLLAVEDVHWADDDTLALLEYVVDNTAAHRAATLITLRGDPPGGALRTVRALADRRAATLLPIEPLPPPDIDRLVLARLGQHAAPEELLHFVRSHADGVPFLAEELLTGLVRAGVLERDDGEWRTTGRLTPTVPVTLADSVRDRDGGPPAGGARRAQRCRRTGPRHRLAAAARPHRRRRGRPARRAAAGGRRAAAGSGTR